MEIEGIPMDESCMNGNTMMIALTQPDGQTIDVPGFMSDDGNISIILPVLEGEEKPGYFELEPIEEDFEKVGEIVLDEAQSEKNPGKRGRKPIISDDLGRFLCEICKDYLPDIEEYRKHKAAHENDNQFICGFCGTGFNNEKTLKFHEIVHFVNSELTCPKCKRKFTRVAAFKSHLAIHAQEEQVSCADCGEEFSNAKYLEQHREKVHAPAEPEPKSNLQCLTCHKLFSNPLTFEKHKNTHRTPENSIKRRRLKARRARHKCPQCDKTFLRPSLVQRHMRIHTGERPFACLKCGMMFNQKGSLNTHMTAKHSTLRPYRCDFCSYSFTQRGNLLTHINKTHNIKPDQDIMPCPKCSCVFKKASSLHCHMTRAHETIQEQEKTLPTVGDDIIQQALRESGVPTGDGEVIEETEAEGSTMTLTERRDDGAIISYTVNVKRRGKVLFIYF